MGGVRPPGASGTYSPKHVDGRRAYARARAGETVTLEAVRVEVESIEIERYAWPDLEIVVRCGPERTCGALARDLGEELGTGGLCEALRRLASDRSRSRRQWPCRPWRTPPPCATAFRHPGARWPMCPPWSSMEKTGGRSRRGRTAVSQIRGSLRAGYGSTDRAGSWAWGNRRGRWGLRLRPRRVLFPGGEEGA